MMQRGANLAKKKEKRRSVSKKKKQSVPSRLLLLNERGRPLKTPKCFRRRSLGDEGFASEKVPMIITARSGANTEGLLLYEEGHGRGGKEGVHRSIG